jgi:hypothetical protein
MKWRLQEPLEIAEFSATVIFLSSFLEPRSSDLRRPQHSMDQEFSDSLLLQHLETLAAQLEIEVRYEDLADDEVTIHSGGCKLQNRNLILIDRHRTLAGRARLLACELSRYDLENFYIPPRVRDFIQASSREKNLPQR